jgi:hypothetical protein
MTRYEKIDELVEELWTSDEASALTNRAARMIEVLYRELISAERELEELRDNEIWRKIHND